MVSQHIVHIAGDGELIFTDHLNDFQDTLVVIFADADLFPPVGQ